MDNKIMEFQLGDLVMCQGFGNEYLSVIGFIHDNQIVEIYSEKDGISYEVSFERITYQWRMIERKEV